MLWMLIYSILAVKYVCIEYQHNAALTDNYAHFLSGLSRGLKQDPPPPGKIWRHWACIIAATWNIYDGIDNVNRAP